MPCSWLPPSVKDVPYAELAYIDFCSLQFKIHNHSVLCHLHVYVHAHYYPTHCGQTKQHLLKSLKVETF